MTLSSKILMMFLRRLSPDHHLLQPGGLASYYYIQGIENFWGITKIRLTKLRGIREDHSNLHSKAGEFRYNMRGDDKHHTLPELL